MNHNLPEWNIEPDLHVPSSQRKPLRPDEELVELLWKNGHVVLNNQTHRNQIQDPNESKKITKHNQETPQNLAQENELLSWIHHCQVDDPFEKELSSFLLPEFIPNISSSNSSLIHHSPFDTSQISHILPYTSKNHCPNSSQTPQIQAQTHEKRCPDTDTNTDTDTNNNNNNHSPTSNGDGFKENSEKTIGRSHCGSNQVIYEDDFAGKVDAFQSERTNERETITGSLSSGGSGFTTWNQYSTGTNSSKRKSRETENSESLSEAALLESGTRKKNAQEFVTTTRKSRASEVHNLSERRRRDRINEKMRALQELLPRSNQTDKASMLDEAIQYMKSLQLQLQMMWMGSQMAPMVFPQYMSRLEMGISPQMIPNLQSGMNLSRLPMMDQARANQANLLNCINYQNQMQNYNFSEQYGPYVGGRFYPSVHSANNQQMNMFSSYGPNTAQPPNQTLPPPGDGNIGPPA